MRPTDRLAPSASASRRPRSQGPASSARAGSTSTDGASMSVTSESYLRLKKNGGLTWSTRYFVLRNATLACFYAKQDADTHRGAMETWHVERAQVAQTRGEAGLTIATRDGKELTVRAFNRADLAKWITAFHRLEVKREAKRIAADDAAMSAEEGKREAEATARRQGEQVEQAEAAPAATATAIAPGDIAKPAGARRVTFHGSVLVRTIPIIPDEQIPELFYSKQEMDEFSARASSLLGRTEHAMNRAYLSLRRPKVRA